MPSAVYNMPNSIRVAAPARASWLAYARALTMTVWFMSLVLNYWWRQDWNDLSEMAAEGVNLKGYYYIGFFTALVGHLTLGPAKWINAFFSLPSTLYGKLIVAFFLFTLILAPLSLDPKSSVKYVLATGCVLLIGALFWETDYRVVRRVLVFTGMVLFAWLMILLLHHGMPRGFASTIGGINRNSIGKLAIVAMICMLFSNQRTIRLAAIGLGVGFLVLVTSRGSLLAVAGFLAVYYTLTQGTSRAVWHALLGFFVAGFVLLASTFLQKAVFQDVLRVNDARRGVGTGFTGRVDNWKECLDVFRKRQVIGYGFRSTAGLNELPTAHSGYINLLLETGVVGTVLIIGAVGTGILQRSRFIQRIRAAAQQAGADPALKAAVQLNVIAVATMVATMMLWVYEPLYINLGNVMSIIFFLMFAAPAWPMPLQSAGVSTHRPLPAGAYR